MVTPLRALGFGLLVCGLGCDPAAAPVELGQRTDEIRNGTREPEAVPLTEGQKLAIGWLHQRGNPTGPFCTGTFIRPNVVATARHCTNGWSARNMAFGVGVDIRNPEATFDVAEIHENQQVDAALLILDEDATARLPQMTPIRANRESLDGPFGQDLRGQDIQAGGYGDTYDRSRDGRWFASVQYTGADNVFVNVDGRGLQGICFGDSGSSVITLNSDGEPVALGVESSGDQSCVGQDRLTRLDKVADWIDGIAGPEPERDPPPAVPEPEEPQEQPEEPQEQPEEPQEQPEEPQEQPQGQPEEPPGQPEEPEEEEDLPVPPPLPEEQGPAPDPVPPRDGTGEACGDVDEIGACRGNTLLWCESGELHSLDCGSQDRVCVLGVATGGAVCETLPDDFVGGDQTCDDVPAGGVCDGNTLIRCVDGNPIETDCGANAQVCGQASAGALCYTPGADGPGGAAATSAFARGGCQQSPVPAPAWAFLLLLGLVRRR